MAASCVNGIGELAMDYLWSHQEHFRKKKKMLENGLFSTLFSRKEGVGRKCKTTLFVTKLLMSLKPTISAVELKPRRFIDFG